MNLLEQGALPALQYLALYINKNDDSVHAANEEIFEELILELSDRVKQHSEHLREQGQQLRELNEKQQRSILHEFVEASRKTSSPAKQRAYRNLSARFWLPTEDIDLLPFWWNRLVDIDPGLWAAMLHLDQRGVKLVDGGDQYCNARRGLSRTCTSGQKDAVERQIS